jgi:hypothetical protein
MPQAVNGQCRTAEWCVQSLLRPYGICGGKEVALGYVYIRVPLYSPVTIIPPVLHAHYAMYIRRYTISATEIIIK